MRYPVVVGADMPTPRPRSVMVAATLIFVIAAIQVADGATGAWALRHIESMSADSYHAAVGDFINVFGGLFAVVLVFMGHFIRRGRSSWRTVALVWGGFSIASAVSLLVFPADGYGRTATLETGRLAIVDQAIGVVIPLLWVAVVILLVLRSSTGYFR